MLELAQKEVFLDTYPVHKTVIKVNNGETLRVECKLNPDLLNEKKPILVEVWTDLNGEKLTGHALKRIKDTNIFSKEFDIKETGMFKITFRYRYKENKFWHWQGSEKHHDFSEIHVDPDYLDKSVVYNAFVRFFGQRKISKEGKINYGESGTFDDLKVKLDVIKKMGVDILYLNPIHIIGELYRNYNPHDQFPNYLQPGCPYSIKDYKSVDPELGIDKDYEGNPHKSLTSPMREFKELVKHAHKKGIKVYMDLVFNHTSHDFILQKLHPEWFLYKEDIKSLNTPYIHPDEIKEGKPWGDPAHTFCPYDHGYWWEDAAQLNWEYQIPPASNTAPDNPTLHDMYEYFKSIPKFWIKHLGIDGFRCDVAYRVPAKFWKECIRESRELAKKEKTSLSQDVVFIGESYCDDLKELLEAGFSAVYGDYSNKLYNPLSLKGYLDYMYNLSGNYFPQGSKFFIFPECHDFYRTPSKIHGDLGPNELLSERTNKSRWVITATLPGIPMIFNGFEKLEWHPVNLFSYSSIDWESDKDLRKHITKVNSIRNKHLALQKGTYSYLYTTQGLNDHTQLMTYTRTYENEKFLICVNMDIHNESGPVVVFLDNSLNLNFDKKYTLSDLLNKQKYVREGRELTVILGPGESHIFKVEQK